MINSQTSFKYNFQVFFFFNTPSPITFYHNAVINSNLNIIIELNSYYLKKSKTF